MRVLIVDDEHNAALMIRYALEELTADVEIIDELEAAQAEITRNPPSVVLLDLHLPPGSTAEQTIERIPDMAIFCPVIVITGMPDKTLAAKCRYNHAKAFLEKLEIARNPQLLIDTILEHATPNGASPAVR